MFFERSDHCLQWFYDGFLMLLPSLSMVFDGSGPLVKRCDGFDGSLWSKPVAFNLFLFTQNKKHSLKCCGRERSVQNPKLVVCLVEFLIYRLQNVFFFLPDRQSVLSDSLEGE